MLKAASFSKTAKDGWADVCTHPKQIAYPVSVQSGTPASCGKYKDDEIDQHIESM